MDLLENKCKYKELIINEVIFKSVQVFILENKIEIVNNWSGLTIAFIYKDDIKTIKIS